MQAELRKAESRFWYGWGEQVAARDGAQAACNAAFEAGARWSLRRSSELSPHIARFIEMLILLGICEDDSVAYHQSAGTPDAGDEYGDR